jgi:hypothetical protein
MPLFRVALASAVVILLAPSFASAGDRMMDGHRHPHHHHAQSVVGGNGLPSVVPGVGTFAGNLSAVRIKGNGIFITLDRKPGRRMATAPAPKAQIIEISAENEDSACSFEAGVCVIRPGR